MYGCVFVCLYGWVSVRMGVPVYVGICVCMGRCLCVWMPVYMYVSGLPVGGGAFVCTLCGWCLCVYAGACVGMWVYLCVGEGLSMCGYLCVWGCLFV